MTEKKETILDVEGMSCGSCVRHVESALGKLEGVTAVEVKLSEKLARVEHDPAKTTVARMVAALADEGYEARERGT